VDLLPPGRTEAGDEDSVDLEIVDVDEGGDRALGGGDAVGEDRRKEANGG
jgi:hypothetical protein